MWLKWMTIFSLLSSQAWAYRFTQDFNNGFYWLQPVVKMMVIDSDPARKANIESIVQSAMMEWEDRTGLNIWSYETSGTNNIIRWSNNFAAETNMDSSSVLAVAIRYTQGPYFAKSEIVINGNHTLNHNNSLLRTTITHELGHTVGLDHSEVPQAVMAPTLQTWYSGLHTDDVQGMRAAAQESENRQITGYVSPLAYDSEQTEKQPLSCGTVGPASAASGVSVNGLLSLVGGLLISFVRKILQWFKSRM